MNKTNRFLSILVGLLFALNVSAFAVEATQPDTSRENLYREVTSQIKLFGEIYRGVNLQYVDPVNPEQFVKAAIDGMLGTLDPYTVFFEPEQTGELDIITQGEYGGVGIEIGLRGGDKALTVIAPIEDTPAARKGLHAGDLIIAVDGKSTKGFSTADASKAIRGPNGTEVTLTILRQGFEKPMDYTLTREAIRIHDVTYSGILESDNIGYIKLSRFSSHAGEELTAALKNLMANKPSGLILDLRSNPGGLLPSAVDVSQQFLNPGAEIVSTKGRSPRTIREFDASGIPLASEISLVVLVNGGSASASEIVAGALQDHDRGVILGTPTFGKGLVQSVLTLSSGAALKITTARYYTPSGRLIQKDRKREDEMVILDEDPTSEMMADSATHDSTATKYITDAGRPVFGGGGITPDIILEPARIDPPIVEMYRRDMFFEFVQSWLTTHENPKSFDVSDEMLQQFYLYLSEKNYTPPTLGSRELESLRELGKRDTLGSEFFNSLDQVEVQLKTKFDSSNPRIRDGIRRGLKMELASVQGGLTARIKASFDYDNQLAEAIKVIKDRKNYSSLLSAAEAPGGSAGSIPRQ